MSQHRWAIFSLVFLSMALVWGVVTAAQAQRTEVSLKIEQSIEAMKMIASIPYSVDQYGNANNPYDKNRQKWMRLATQLNDVIRAANPADVDNDALDKIVDQFRDPEKWGSSPLSPAVAHLGSRGILKLVEVIKGSSDSFVQDRFLDGLYDVAGELRNTDVNSQAIAGMVGLLGSANPAVRGLAAEALGAIGSSARTALPALERSLQAARIEEMKGGLFLGPTESDLEEMAIAQIRGEPNR